jgi:hypothetical protein
MGISFHKPVVSSTKVPFLTRNGEGKSRAATPRSRLLVKLALSTAKVLLDHTLS